MTRDERKRRYLEARRQALMSWLGTGWTFEVNNYYRAPDGLLWLVYETYGPRIGDAMVAILEEEPGSRRKAFRTVFRDLDGTEFRFPLAMRLRLDQADEPYIVSMRIRADEGLPRLVSLMFESRGLRQEIQTHQLRKSKINRLRDAAIRLGMHAVNSGGDDTRHVSDDEATAVLTRAKHAAPRDPSRRLRGSERDALIREAVRLYRAAINVPGGDKSPTQTVADTLNYHRSYIGRLLVEARREGLLGPAKRGRAGEEEQ